MIGLYTADPIHISVISDMTHNLSQNSFKFFNKTQLRVSLSSFQLLHLTPIYIGTYTHTQIHPVEWSSCCLCVYVFRDDQSMLDCQFPSSLKALSLSHKWNSSTQQILMEKPASAGMPQLLGASQESTRDVFPCCSLLLVR